MICPVCKEELIKLYMVGWAHKAYSTCSLPDGLALIEQKEDDMTLYSFEVIDTQMRVFFIKKMNQLEQEAPLNAQINEISKKVVEQPSEKGYNEEKRLSKKQWLKEFEPYYD